MLSIATLGGILLCVGALCTYKGKVFWAVSVYLLADICWIWLAFNSSDYKGAAFTIIGTLLGFAAFLKMRFGIMDKDLTHK